MNASHVTSVFPAFLIALAIAGCASAPPVTQGAASTDRQQVDQQVEMAAAAKREERAIAAVNPENSVFFETNSAIVDTRARETLRSHAEQIKANPGQRVLLVGFTDDRGSHAYNSAIAEMRVNAVYKVLREYGVKLNRLRRYSAGGEKSTVTCSSDECRALMRRVELDYSSK